MNKNYYQKAFEAINASNYLVFSDTIDYAKQIFSEFKDLSRLKQKEFNAKLNEYIKSLPADWEKTLLDDFNDICADQIFHNFEPEKMGVPILTGNTLLLTEEQERLKAEENWIV
jgi:hypothetical protein